MKPEFEIIKKYADGVQEMINKRISKYSDPNIDIDSLQLKLIENYLEGASVVLSGLQKLIKHIEDP